MLTPRKDDFRQAKGEYSSNAEAYVKEVRKARKEAFKSASVVLKLQETLRDTQKRLQVSKIDLFNSPRKSLSPRKQRSPSFSDDKENVGVVTKKMVETRRLQEELDVERQKREAAEEMAEFLRMECAFQCCDCTSVARHGRAMRVSMDEILASSIQKMRSDIARILTPPASEKGEDDMEVETHSAEAETVETAASEQAEEESQPQAMDEVMGEDPHNIPLPEGDSSMTMIADEAPNHVEEKIPSASHSTDKDSEQVDEQIPTQDTKDTEGEEETQSDTRQHEISRPAITVPLKDSPPATPERAQQNRELDAQLQHSIRTITTTTRIPMHFTPVSKPSVLTSWGQENNAPECAVDDGPLPAALPFDREAALAAIAYRRGRAKSIADGTHTPRKQMVDLQRRDISAPVIGTQDYTPKPRSLSSRSTGKSVRAGGFR
jgi:hypothetical protein